MRLRTECNGSGVTVGSDDEYTHDAMAAHAYKQALADWHEKNGTGPDEDAYPEAAVAFIEKRAAEILAGWMGEDRG